MVYKRSEAQIMEKIRAALRIAERAEDGSPEQEAALRSANGLMTKHAIDQAKLDASRTIGEKRTPVQMTFPFVAVGDVSWEYLEQFRTLMARIARTNRCRVAIHPGAKYNVTVVGMQEDVEWTQLLWMQIFMEFVSKISPSWNLEKGIGENVADLKDAGYKWEAIWREGKRANPEMDDLESYDAGKARYLMREYKQFVAENPREVVGTNRHKAYRFSFVKAYTRRIASRLEQMEADSTEAVETSGSAVAMMDVRHRVDEEFYRVFPSHRPLTREELIAREAEQYAKDQAFLASLSPAQLKKVLHEREVQARKDERYAQSYWRKQDEHLARMDHSDGARAGRQAADNVNLSRHGQVPGTAARKAVEG